MRRSPIVNPPIERIWWGMVMLSVALWGATTWTSAADEPGLPLVIQAQAPLYPVIVRASGIEGEVKLKVVSDGEKIQEILSEQGPFLLVKAARENVLTWRFEPAAPQTFEVVFVYRIDRKTMKCFVDNGTATLSLPSKVEITAPGVWTCDPFVDIPAGRESGKK